MNKVIMLGRLTKDPVKRTSADGNKVVGTFNIAVDRKFKREGDPDADFFSCTCFGKLAEFMDKYLQKGSKIAIAGEIQNDNYTNQKGEKVYSTRIIVNEIDFAESKKDGKPAAEEQSEFFSPEDLDSLPFK